MEAPCQKDVDLHHPWDNPDIFPSASSVSVLGAAQEEMFINSSDVNNRKENKLLHKKIYMLGTQRAASR